MKINGLDGLFKQLTVSRRVDPAGTVARLGGFAAGALRLLTDQAEAHPLPWCGAGSKTYQVYAPAGQVRPWSRGINTDLFIVEPDDFMRRWNLFTAMVLDSVGTMTVDGLEAAEANRLFYTAVMGYATLMDLAKPNRGGPGTFLEMLVGPTVALLLDRPESGEIQLPVPETTQFERVKVDLTFESPKAGSRHLVIPTKISTRERISQAFVHQRILDAARPNEYRSVLCASNENNARHAKGVAAADRSVLSLELLDTLVPGTIALYQRYVAKLSGLYYLDPPAPYMAGKFKGLPPVRSFGQLLTGDLAGLL